MICRFGVFEFDDRTTLLSRSNRLVALEPQPARALTLLLARAGDVVSRDELRAHLWGADTHVDVDRGLAYCIGQLRTALGDTADNPRFIQTLPRRGFRFIAPVQLVDAIAAGGDIAQSPAHSPAAEPTPTRWFETWKVSTVALLLGATGAWMVAHGSLSSRPIVAVAVFENESGDDSHERATSGLADVVVERLTALGPERIGVNGNASILRQPRGARDQQAVAHDTRASFLVSGQLQTKDGHPSLLMQLIKLDDGTHVWVQRISRPPGDALHALDQDAARQIEAAVRQFVLKDGSGKS
jgi:DNA-binding winged helix-turn-helix (wHTH) protein/TolB-like protein